MSCKEYMERQKESNSKVRKPLGSLLWLTAGFGLRGMSQVHLHMDFLEPYGLVLFRQEHGHRTNIWALHNVYLDFI